MLQPPEPERTVIQTVCGHETHHGTCAFCQRRAKARQGQHIADSVKAKAEWQRRMRRMPTL